MTRWWKDVGERMIATAVQAALAVVVVALADSGRSDINIDWKATISIALVAACASFWKGWAAQLRGDPNSASLVKDVGVK